MDKISLLFINFSIRSPFDNSDQFLGFGYKFSAFLTCFKEKVICVFGSAYYGIDGNK